MDSNAGICDRKTSVALLCAARILLECGFYHDLLIRLLASVWQLHNL